MAASIGLHYVELGDFAAAKRGLSARSAWKEAIIPSPADYLQIVRQPDAGGGDQRNQRQTDLSARIERELARDMRTDCK